MDEQRWAAWWDQVWLPLRPYATDDLSTGLRRASRATALQRRYIEANPHALSNLLVIDIDHADATMRALWCRPKWLPNAVIENLHNGHAHAVWALKDPICRTDYARRKPLALATAITEGLRRSVDGDCGYAGLITKNPTNTGWDTHWITDHLYALTELSTHLDEEQFLPPASWRRTRRHNPAGLGRNCAIFETARTWAYREARRIRQRHELPTTDDSTDLHAAIAIQVDHLNATFAVPLPTSETRAIAASIHRWITTRSNLWSDSRVVSEATFTLIQSARGRKSGEQRRAALDAKLEAL